jgi:hypothetical protein
MQGCSHKPIILSSGDIEVSRENPSSKCHEVGPVSGATTSIKATQKDALEDMKREAAAKGANFIKIEQFSDSGTAVTGTSYQCP